MSNYCLAFNIYQGKSGTTDVEKMEMKEYGQGYAVVKKLLTVGKYLNKGYTVFTDNFFFSIPLTRYLYETGTFCTGTIRSNRKGLPKESKKKYPVGTSKFWKNGEFMLCSYTGKKSQKN